MTGIDFKAIETYLTSIVTHYEQSSPATANYIDDLYIRLREDSRKVTMFELLRTGQYQDTDSGEWMQANFAQNYTYKTLDMLGRDTSGMIDY